MRVTSIFSFFHDVILGLPYRKSEIFILATFYLSSAYGLNLIQSKFFLFDKELTKY